MSPEAQKLADEIRKLSLSDLLLMASQAIELGIEEKRLMIILRYVEIAIEERRLGTKLL